jgi:hypothetical protein
MDIDSLLEHNDAAHQLACKLCKGSFFESAESLKKHKESTHCHECPDCKEIFEIAGDLARHVIGKHMQAFKCENCLALLPPAIFVTQYEDSETDQSTIHDAYNEISSFLDLYEDPPAPSQHA